MTSTTPRFTAAHLLNRLTGGTDTTADILRSASDRQQYLTHLSAKGLTVE